MADAAMLYPMMRRRRRRGWRIRVSPRVRSIAVLAVCALLVLGGTAKLLLRPAPVDARVLLSNALTTWEAGNYNAARSNALAAVAAAPQSGAAQAVLARAYLELGEGLAAEAALTRAEAAGFPATRLHQLRAEARLLQGDADGALAEVAEAAPRYADYAERIRARALAVQGQTIAARAALERLVAEHPGNGQAWLDLGRLRFAGGDPGGASEAAGAAVRLLPRDPHALALEGEVVRARYGLVAALPWFEAALKRDTYAMPTLIDYAATLGETGRNAEMLAALRRAAAARPGDARVLYLYAVLAARAGRLELAGSLLERNGAVSGLAGAQLLRGAIDYAGGRWERAAASWRALSDNQPMNLTARRLLATALLRSGDAQGALAVLRPLAVRGDADAYALTLTARAFEATGDRVSAASFLDRAASAGRSASPSFATDEALATLQAEAADAPGDPTYAVGVIRGLIGGGDMGAALGQARTLVQGGAGTPAAQTAYGDVLALAGQRPDAAYARAADLRFDEPAMLRLIDARGRSGQADAAAATLALYLAQNPQSVAALRLLGHLQVAAGQWDAAIETLEGVRRRVGSGEVALLADLALAYAGDGDGEVAVRYGRAAYAAQPMNAGAADAYGVALAAAGRGDAARQVLDKAVVLAPGDPVIAGHRRQLG
ncbi:tetratricopeptide repeat protein [Sphingomonas sp. Leaf343]|uniref:tetratricopeptide repeat protein n=1 Tax=Sphingomonas sp. Leaf343 TaxID=1736345 RepID=UPI0006F75694|nr:tetratricopeptide repeat protein [Sphingomonas sp. Leaf343]KQR88029.1 hypothetical protein ASG07_04085 [Sphingomonas sp. Leaf343]